MLSHPNFPTPAGWNFRDIQLEMSLKPFFDNSPETRERVIRELFEQWRPLWRHAETISVMLWIAEGSESLEYDGNLETEFEWARYHGAPNKHHWDATLPSGKRGVPDHGGLGLNGSEWDPEGKGIHNRAYLYRECPAVFTYRWLRDLVSDLKRIGREISGLDIWVGDTFDIGPEFAKSRFKFDWHREILGDGPLFKEQFVSCEAVLKGDERCYAAYPEGIPEGTRIGTFLGKQLNALFDDCGFDFLWLSNGFGFSLEPWAMVGEVFDGENFHPERSEGIKERILNFWRDLRGAFPLKYHLRTRGTNMATGIDVGSDASPLREIYEGGFGVDAPVNSPWAALDGDFGLELSGWMSHIARHPGETFRYRFYIHDPWWLNSPWLDRYNRTPHDIYLPMSVSRLQKDGTVALPRDISFLTVDDSHGMMPLQVPNEVIPQLLRSRETAPDACGPLLWVYPFDDVHASAPERALHVDSFMGAAINEGVPLNTVVDLPDVPGKVQGTILISSVPAPGSASEALLWDRLGQGASLILIGAMQEGSVFLEELGMELADALSGDFAMPDGRILSHLPMLSGGGFREKGGCAILNGEQEGQVRTVSAVKGRLAWTRGSLSTAEFDPEDPKPIRGPILRPLDPVRFVPAGQLLRELLAEFGWRISAQTHACEPRFPYLLAHRFRNAYIFSGYSRDEQAVLKLRHPLGAPLLKGMYNRVDGGQTKISGAQAWQNECRVFLEEGEDGVIQSKEVPQLMHGVYRRLLIIGAQNASLNFLVETGHTDQIRILRDPHFPYFVGEVVDPVIQQSAHGPIIRIGNVNETILIEW
ncbi:hypothetical protein P0Y35_13595 [Kiritimatiellaeota bacterium B1221]|nr:hypothetical protein [Kiritimatiellaeota bacterium B1221]